MDDDDITIAAACLVLSLELQITSSHAHMQSQNAKKDSAPQGSAFICRRGINTVFIQPSVRFGRLP